MKILQIAALSNTANGAVNVVRDLSEALVEQGHRVGLLGSSYNGDKEPALPNRIEYLGHYPSKSKYKAPFSMPSDKYLRNTAFWEPDVVHFHGVFEPVQARLADGFTRRGIPYIITPHGNLMKAAIKRHEFKKVLALKSLLSKYLKNATYIHALGHEEANDISRLFPNNQIAIIANGIKDHQKVELKSLEQKQYSSSGLKFLFMGRVDVHHKGLDLLMQATSHIAPLFRSTRSVLYITGPYNSIKDREILKKMISVCGIDDIVKITGPKYNQEKIDQWHNIDVFVHTSRYEGMPLAVLEALAQGIPCLVTPGTNLSNVIAQADAGWAAEENEMAIADSLKEIIQTPRSIIKQKAINSYYLSDQFKFSVSVSRLINLYEDATVY